MDINALRWLTASRNRVHWLGLLIGVVIGPLDVSGSHVTSAGWDAIGKSRRLVLLDLSFTTVGQAERGMKSLSTLRKLRSLTLLEYDLADKDLIPLNEMAALRELFLIGTRVSATGVDRLQMRLPKCHIVWKQRLVSEA